MEKKYLSCKEIMEALINGKKITSESWDIDEYIYFDENGNIICENDLSFCDEFSNDMYVYEEPKEKEKLFLWALAGNKDCYYNICTNFMTEEEAKLVHGENVIKTNVSILVDKE